MYMVITKVVFLLFVTSQDYIPGFVVFFLLRCSDDAPRLRSETLTLIKNTRLENAVSNMFYSDERGILSFIFKQFMHLPPDAN